ncbi:MAG: pyridoxal-phosphate dependent enzyme [Kineosporiaceae bacterium]
MSNPIPGPIPGRTPMLRVTLAGRHRETNLWLKLEQENPFGSMKDRVAYSLLESCFENGRPPRRIIESTSGNLGVALARYAQICGIEFTAVVDPRTPRRLLRAMRNAGAHVVEVTEADASGGFLLARLAYVRARLAADPHLRWPNQYESDANPRAHSRGTAPEILGVLGRATPVDVFVGVSTGGTMRGFRDFIEAEAPPWRCVGVDETGSVALGGEPSVRRLNGIGSSQRSLFLAGAVDDQGAPPHVLVDAPAAVAACDWVAHRLGVRIGGSSGAVVAGALARIREGRARADVVAVCADGGDRYEDTIYSEAWRRRQGWAEVPALDPPDVLASEFVDDLVAVG